MAKKGGFFIFIFLILGVSGVAQKIKIIFDAVITDSATLAQNKKALATGKSALQPSYNQLLEIADELLDYKPVSVMDKTQTPPSGDKHDYISLAPYWWPDSSKKDGLPYIRKDGVTNPETKNFPDKNNMPKLCENIYLLGLAYYYSGKPVYAKKAARLIEVWFLDQKTSMNPNLNFSQFIKGLNEGRGAGIIDSRHFIFVLDAVQLIKTSKSWTTNNETRLQQWFKDLLQWFENSQNGLDEKNAPNNHGVWYEAQVLAMATYLNDKVKATEIINRAIKKLDVEMDENGLFPLEMERTIALHYNVFILNAFYIIAQLSEKTDIDFWNVKTKSGKSLQKGLDALFPYLSNQKTWTGQQIKPFPLEEGFPVLIKAAGKLQCEKCYNELIKLVTDKTLLYYLL